MIQIFNTKAVYLITQNFVIFPQSYPDYYAGNASETANYTVLLLDGERGEHHPPESFAQTDFYTRICRNY